MEVGNDLINSTDTFSNEDNENDSNKDRSPVDNVLEISEENKNLKLTVQRLEKEIAVFDGTVGQQRLEIESLQTAARRQAEQAQKQIDQLKSDLGARIEKLTKQYEQASREREAMVMKYAVSENNAITLQNQMKQLENKIRDNAKEKESLEGKISNIVNEKGKLLQVIDSKCVEIQGLEREVLKKKDELHAQSSNLKFFQNKLKSELENHKEVQKKMDKLNRELKEAKEETEQVRKDCQAMLMRYEADGRKELELQYADQVESLRSEVDSWRAKQKELTDENNQLCKKIQNLETERLDYEQNVAKLKQDLNEHQQSLVDYYSVQAELESLRLMLVREQERYASSQAEIDRLRVTNHELQVEMTKCREREAELLNFTRKLTEKNVAIQSDLISIEARFQQQEVDLTAVKREVNELTTELKAVKEELISEKRKRCEEVDSLSKQLEERNQTVERLSTLVEDQKGENQLLKKKHMASIKELSRELQAYRKKGEAMETVSLGRGSHTSSNTSLNYDDENRVTGSLDLDQQALVSKLIVVQNENRELKERKSFLKENNRQLIAELQRKSRVIQILLLNQNSGAMTSELMDENKAALAKQGGIMASVYNSKAVDDTMTLELSLEMNQKVQAVLEDTLLKNFALKESLDILGNEISQLKLAAAQKT